MVGEGSEAQFTVGEQLAALPLPSEATVHNRALTGEVHLDGRPSVIQIDLRRFASDQPRRDDFVRRLSSRQPTATVTIDSIGALPEQYTAGDIVQRRVAGRLKIFDFEGPITFAVEARLDGGQLSILGTTQFRWADFHVAPPNVLGIVQVQDEVHARILLVAQAAAG